MEICNNGGWVGGVSYQRYGRFKCRHGGADFSDLGKPLFSWIQVE
jgi:hypothetical protein